MRSGLGLLAVMLIAAAIGVVAAHNQSSTAAATSGLSTPASVPVPRARTVFVLSSPSGGTYAPSTITVRLGQTVTWINRDTSDHTATADNGAFNTDVLTPGQKYVWKAKKIGTFPYSDYIQSNTQGTLIVTR